MKSLVVERCIRILQTAGVVSRRSLTTAKMCHIFYIPVIRCQAYDRVWTVWNTSQVVPVIHRL